MQCEAISLHLASWLKVIDAALGRSAPQKLGPWERSFSFSATFSAAFPQSMQSWMTSLMNSNSANYHSSIHQFIDWTPLGKGSPYIGKHMFIWALPKWRLDPPFAAFSGTLWHIVFFAENEQCPNKHMSSYVGASLTHKKSLILRIYLTIKWCQNT